MSGSGKRRGPGRPPGKKKMRLRAEAERRGESGPRRRLVGKVRKWERRVTPDGHLEVTGWCVVPGSDRHRRFEEEPRVGELLAVAGGENSSEEEEAVVASRKRQLRGKAVQEHAAAVVDTSRLDAVRYRCPLRGCQAPWFHKVAGLLAHTRMKHKMPRDTVDESACKFLVRLLPDGTEVPVVDDEKEKEGKKDEPEPALKRVKSIKFKLTMPTQPPPG